MQLNGTNIFWDLDGVLRDLGHTFNGYGISDWNGKTDNGKTFTERIDADLNLLKSAPELCYIEIAKRCSPVHVVSIQPDNWRKNTSIWLDNHLPQAKVKFLNVPEHKLLYLQAGTRILIEDYPFFTDYTNVILVDRPYNKNVNCKHRVSSPDELLPLLRRFIDDKNLG